MQFSKRLQRIGGRRMSNNNLKLREEVMKGLNVLEKMENPLEIRMLKTKKGTRSGYYIDKNKLLSDIQ